MFECRACLSRSLRAIAGDVANTHKIPRGRHQLILTPHRTPPIRRASTAVVSKAVYDDVFPPALQTTEGDAFDNAEGKKKKKKSKSLVADDAKALRTELKYLADPVKLAEHVRYTLRCNKPEKALTLCRLASKEAQVIVSWNHCIDWHVSQQKFDAAFGIYNEMKKRAQFPDSYTYLILLRGLAKPAHWGEVVREANALKAVSLYNSMNSPTSRVRPSIIHTNAALKVCSAALDMDGLWGIAAKLPAKGKGAPDVVTYTTLLIAIRHGAYGNNPEGAQLEQIASRRQVAVNQGRRIWQEIIPKWRAGEVKIDEELVCAMGRLLLLSKRLQDWDDVLSLVQQTMAIDRQIAPLGSADRHTEHIPEELENAASAEEDAEDAEGYRDAPSTKAFDPVSLLQREASTQKPSELVYVTPGNPTLSMLIGACTVLRIPKTANAYWNLLTSAPCNVKPDKANYHAQFRLLGMNRASAKAVEILRSMPEKGIRPMNDSFRIVMSVCVRDKNNRNVIQHARGVVDVMQAHLKEPDIHTLLQYLNLAVNTYEWEKITSVLDHLEPIVQKLRERVEGQGKEGTEKKEIIGLCQAIVGAIDTLMNGRLLPAEDRGAWHGRRSELARFIGIARNHGERRDAEMRDEGLEKEEVEPGSEAYRARNAERGRYKGSAAWYQLRKLRDSRREEGLAEGRARTAEVAESRPRERIKEKRGRDVGFGGRGAEAATLRRYEVAGQ